MAGIPLPSCAVGVNARWKSCAFVWAKDGALVVAATATAFNGVADEYRLMVGRFDGGDPSVAPDVQTLVDTGVTYVSLDARPDGTLDLFYFVDRNQILYRSSRDSGLTWSAAVGLPIGSPSGTIEAADSDTGFLLSAQRLRHCYSPEQRLILAGYFYIPGTTYVQDAAGWGSFAVPPIAPRWAVIAGTPDGAGGITWETPIGIASFNLPSNNSNNIVAFEPLAQGSLAAIGWGLWAEGIKSDFTIKHERSLVGTENPQCGWWDLKRNLLIMGYDSVSLAGGAHYLPAILFHAWRLNDATTGLTALADPPGVMTYSPPAPTSILNCSYLRAGRDARFWLLRPEPTSGDLGFVRLEKFGEAGSAGSWV